jgi:hypothetical protein
MDKFTVHGVDGSVDVNASVAAYTKALTDWVSRNEVPATDIERAMHAVFDNSASAIPTTMLVYTVSTAISKDPALFPAISKQVHSYIKAQTSLGTQFTVVRGHGGGVVRVHMK